MKKSRVPAAVALLASVSSLFLPWWKVEHAYASGEVYERTVVGLWKATDVAHFSGQRMASGLMVVAVILLALRVMGDSWKHEPKAWRRDLIVADICLWLAVLVAMRWPMGIPSFWGGRTFQAADTTFTQVSAPLLGWWLVLLAAGLVIWSRVMCRAPKGAEDAMAVLRGEQD